MIPANTQAQTGQNQTPTLDDLHRAFADVCFYYCAIVNNYGVNDSSEKNRLRRFADDAKKLAAIAMQLHSNILEGAQ